MSKYTAGYDSGLEGEQSMLCITRHDKDQDTIVAMYKGEEADIIQAAINSAKREVLEQIRPPQATIDSMKLTQPHKYRGVEYPCCSICGFCPEAINAFIDSQLEQSEESE